MDNSANTSFAPHIRRQDTLRSIMLSNLIALSVLIIAPIIIYGFRTVVLVFMSVLGAVGVEAIWRFVQKREQTVTDLTAVCSGIVCAYLMPAGVPIWLPLLASAFGALVAKMPFGGHGRAIFNPAVAGYAFAVLSFGQYFVSYTRIGDEETSSILPIFATPEILPTDFEHLSPISILLQGNHPNLNAGELLLAMQRGPLGTTAVLLIAGALVWLWYRKASAWQSSAAFIATVFVLSFFFRFEAFDGALDIFLMPVYELLCGSMLFSAVFLAGELSTAPKFASARVLYGIIAGILAMILRHGIPVATINYGAVAGGEAIAVMLVNPAAGALDRLVWRCRERGISFSALKVKAEDAVKKKFKTHNEEEEIYGPKV